MSYHPFQPGDQVWTNYEEDWWPAKVVSPESLGMEDTGAVVVQFYPTNEISTFNYDPNLVVPFETSSSKAITSNPDIQVAIQAALADPTANNNNATAAATAAPRQRQQQQQQASAPPKKESGARRGRPAASGAAHEDQQQHRPSNTAAAAAAVPVDQNVTDAALTDMSERLEAAIKQQNIADLRRLLLKLARIKPSYHQLVLTQIGYHVGSIIKINELAPMHSIVVCILRFWMQELPEATKDALRRYAARATGAGLAVLYGETEQDHNQQQISNDDGSEQQQQQHVASGAEGSVPSGLSEFGTKVAQRFVKYNCNDQNTTENIVRFCNEADEQLRSIDGRKKLMAEISKESHSTLRADLLTGKISLERFLSMTTHELLTREEVEGEKEDAEALAWRAREGKNELTGNALFECPECGKSNSVQNEKQTRSADEAATVFITCLECGHIWTEG